MEYKTEEEVIEDCNKLAIKFYKKAGFVVEEDYKMYDATHPEEVFYWDLAVLAYDFIEGTDVLSALDEIDVD